MIKELFFHSWKKYLLCLLYGILIYTLYCSLREMWFTLFSFQDATFITGLSLLCIGGLSTLNYFGAYDFWGYTFSKRDQNGKRMPISDYTEQKRIKRKKGKYPFGPYYAAGLFYLLISIILTIV